MLSRPSVFQYHRIQQYLKDFYIYKKTVAANFSYGSWADQMGIRSRSYVRAVVLGEKALQESLLPNLLKGLELSEEELNYFVLLFKYELAPTNEIKNLYSRELFSTWSLKVHQEEIKDVEEFLEDPIMPVVFTYLAFEPFSADPSVIAKDLNCEVERIHKALRYLIWNKLIEGKASENGQFIYKTIKPFFKISSASANTYLKNFHLDGLKMAQEKANLPSEVRKMYSSFIALDADQFQQAQKLIEDFNQKLLSIFSSSKRDAKTIYRINQQLFPVSEIMRPDAEIENNILLKRAL